MRATLPRLAWPRAGGVQGHVEEARWLLLKLSAVDLFGYAIIFALLASPGPGLVLPGRHRVLLHVCRAALTRRAPVQVSPTAGAPAQPEK
jgi:hypothetical protein